MPDMSLRELVEDAIARTETLNSALNAVIALDKPGALARQTADRLELAQPHRYRCTHAPKTFSARAAYKHRALQNARRLCTTHDATVVKKLDDAGMVSLQMQYG